ncbi:Ni(II)/Co(II)-binding transcriptional repressor RcnR [Escherichia coli]|uniref:Ni(II)/Co(II)-binding transcriptional repressor RcnR n=1 Tax=Escherichia coli TaxID=562 RepID=UPI00159C48B3|nr:Ni(II)/Co(II)-binding transcriptional repressor RcnR [Escherichia coli]NVL95128.1 Ni(II)/Co(II)-binding transcriptional repressor RcnR [Escherichia coli]QLQ59568.1 Ni(II)/Co(II)-binding transcriptional repressor RcnR [Escherichia coli]
MSHTIRDKQKLKARASKIQGQVVALKKMLDEPHDYAAVLQQIAAIRGAVNGLMREVIKGHLTEHIVHQGDELKREEDLGNDSNLLIVFYVQIMPDDFVMQLHRF